jgi:hypothetical protein
MILLLIWAQIILLQAMKVLPGSRLVILQGLWVSLGLILSYHCLLDNANLVLLGQIKMQQVYRIVHICSHALWTLFQQLMKDLHLYTDHLVARSVLFFIPHRSLDFLRNKFSQVALTRLKVCQHFSHYKKVQHPVLPGLSVHRNAALAQKFVHTWDV